MAAEVKRKSFFGGTRRAYFVKRGGCGLEMSKQRDAKLVKLGCKRKEGESGRVDKGGFRFDRCRGRPRQKLSEQGRGAQRWDHHEFSGGTQPLGCCLFGAQSSLPPLHPAHRHKWPSLTVLYATIGKV